RPASTSADASDRTPAGLSGAGPNDSALARGGRATGLPAFRTVREAHRLTRLLSSLPLVTGTQRQGLAAWLSCRLTAARQSRCSSSRFDRWLLLRSRSLWCRSNKSSPGEEPSRVKEDRRCW